MDKNQETKQTEDISQPITHPWSSDYFLRVIFVVVYGSHWIFLILLGIFVVTVTLQFGHFPQPGNPDPNSVEVGAIGILQNPTIFFMGWGISTTPIVIILIGIRLWKQSIGWQEIGLYFGGLILFWFINLNDVARLGTWLVD